MISSARMLRLLVLAAAFPLRAMASSGGQGTTVFGRVVDPKGHPIPGAEVVLNYQLNGRSFETLSDAAGNFQFRHIDSVNVEVDVAHPGYTHAHRRGLDISSGAPSFDSGSFQLERGVVVDGRVVDSNGAPVAEANVYVLPAEIQDVFTGHASGEALGWAKTASNGSFHIADLRAGEKVRVTVDKTGFAESSVHLQPPATEPTRIVMEKTEARPKKR